LPSPIWAPENQESTPIALVSPVALLSPLPTPRLGASALLERWKNVPVIDADQLRDDIAQILDVAL